LFTRPFAKAVIAEFEGKAVGFGLVRLEIANTVLLYILDVDITTYTFLGRHICDF